MKTKQLTNDWYWVGTQDPDLRIFDILMYTEFGTSYNSYVLKGSEKKAVFETSKVKFADEYLEKLTEITPLDEIDYIIVSHTEPDHSGTIEKLLELNPKLKLVGTSAAMNFMKEICNRDFTSVVVKDGDKLSLGNKTLKFIIAAESPLARHHVYLCGGRRRPRDLRRFSAPIIRWEGVTNDTIPSIENYESALKYYFDGIVAPFKSFVLDAIKKVEGLQINMILTGHGPALTNNPMAIVEKYREWSTGKESEHEKNRRHTLRLCLRLLPKRWQRRSRKAFRPLPISMSGCTTWYTPTRIKSLTSCTGRTGSCLVRRLSWVKPLKPIWDLTTDIFAKTHGKKIASAFGSYGWSGEGVPPHYGKGSPSSV